jgi:hypothetical protein
MGTERPEFNLHQKTIWNNGSSRPECIKPTSGVPHLRAYGAAAIDRQFQDNRSFEPAICGSGKSVRTVSTRVQDWRHIRAAAVLAATSPARVPPARLRHNAD